MKLTKVLLAVTLSSSSIAQADAPRVLRSGAPACGNMPSKGGDDDDGECARVRQERREAEAKRVAKRAAVQRVLAVYSQAWARFPRL